MGSTTNAPHHAIFGGTQVTDVSPKLPLRETQGPCISLPIGTALARHTAPEFPPSTISTEKTVVPDFNGAFKGSTTCDKSQNKPLARTRVTHLKMTHLQNPLSPEGSQSLLGTRLGKANAENRDEGDANSGDERRC